jgi:hypothetical protein
MLQTLILNFLIILLTGFGLVLTGDPLMVLVLFFMHDLPMHVVTNEQQIRAAAMEKDHDDDDDDPNIGFTAKI